MPPSTTQNPSINKPQFSKVRVVLNVVVVLVVMWVLFGHFRDPSSPFARYLCAECIGHEVFLQGLYVLVILTVAQVLSFFLGKSSAIINKINIVILCLSLIYSIKFTLFVNSIVSPTIIPHLLK